MMSKFDDISDNLLVMRIHDDCKDAFKSLYDRYGKRLYYFSLRYLCSDEEAKDLVQTVFISIWEHRKSLDATLSIKNYIYTSAVNNIYNCMKKKAIRAKFIESNMKKGEPYYNFTYDQVFFNEMEGLLFSIIKTLPSHQQRIFQLSRFEGLTHEEIAKKLDISVRTVENQIYRALKIIKSKLKDEIFFVYLFLKITFLNTLL